MGRKRAFLHVASLSALIIPNTVYALCNLDVLKEELSSLESKTLEDKEKNKVLKEVAEKRLQAIREFTDLGSGFRIAMKDLEIRGAGNLLGKTQHGHMEAVGYDMYCSLLGEAVARLRGEKIEEKKENG